jgi:carbamoylphosphate synthase small subunit
MIHKSKPFMSTQFHPEASGGPSDTIFLFDKFIDTIKEWKNR